jgi:hypothetical protein
MSYKGLSLKSEQPEIMDAILFTLPLCFFRSDENNNRLALVYISSPSLVLLVS